MNLIKFLIVNFDNWYYCNKKYTGKNWQKIKGYLLKKVNNAGSQAVT